MCIKVENGQTNGNVWSIDNKSKTKLANDFKILGDPTIILLYEVFKTWVDCKNMSPGAAMVQEQ